MLYWLVPEDVIRRHEDDIYEVMGELAEILRNDDDDTSSWPDSWRECFEWAYYYFFHRDLADLNLIPRLKMLGDTSGAQGFY